MNTEVDTETLSRWLEEGRPVTVWDVRDDRDRAEWHIPGSLHVNAMEALKDGRTDALPSIEFPAGRTVVVVCPKGRTSRIAAGELRARGVEAVSLAGGMQAWSLAWNTAPVALPHPTAAVLQVRRTGKGCLSYLLGSEGQAAVIDASLPPEIYLRLSEERGWKLRYAIDTHIHADHLSRGRALAEMAGAEYLLPAQDRARFPYRPIHDRDTLRIGAARLAAFRTPGHTWESTCYVLDNQALFTGDTLFLAAVGRPDLGAAGGQTAARARMLFQSLQRIARFGPGLLVLPGHTPEPVPFDGKPLVATLRETARQLADWGDSEETFVRRVLEHLPPAPENHLKILEYNLEGVLPEGDVTELEAGANRCAVSKG